MQLECNICGGVEFGKTRKGRRDVRCLGCGSLERARLLFMYLSRIELNKQTRVLHLAPEPGIYRFLKSRLSPENYVTADFNPVGFKYVENCRHIDLCNMQNWPSDHFDLILHMHVLEHTPCNIAYTLFHLSRMLKTDGTQLCVIPFHPNRWDESFLELSDEKRVVRFGQFDHVRRFGRKDLEKHLGCIVNLPENFNALEDFPEESLRKHNIAEVYWSGFTGCTVLQIKKDDFLLR